MAKLKAKALGLALVVSASATGLSTISRFEGLGQPGQTLQRAYPDPYLGWRKATICYGHTANVQRGDTATLAQCEQWFSKDVASHTRIVYNALAPFDIWLTQGEQDAYVSLAYNLGQFKNTPSVYGRLLQGDDWGACMGLLKYHYSGGTPSRGLWNRRYAEYNLCINQLDYKYAEDIAEYLAGDYPRYQAPIPASPGPSPRPLGPVPQGSPEADSGAPGLGTWWTRLVALLQPAPGGA